MLLWLCLCGTLSAQHEGNTWYFGYHAGVSFVGGTPQALTDGSINQYEGVATISDRSGNLLFYSEGLNVYNANHAIMPNGGGLLGTQSTTQTVIVPAIAQDSLFYLFYADALSGSSMIWYSVVDMRSNGGLGDVVMKNMPLDSNFTEKMCVVKHANGVDSWLITHVRNSQDFRAYLINCGGIQPNPVVSSVGSMHNTVVGYLKASCDGRKLALTLGSQGNVEVMRFDPSTGEIYSPLVLAGLADPYGIEFSANGQLLYVTTDNMFSEVLQFDLNAGNAVAVMGSRFQVSLSNFGSYTAIQRGPDGKLYIGKSLGSHLATIAQPDIMGGGCGFNDQGLFLQGKMCFHGLPNTYEAYPHPWLDTVRFQLSAVEICIGQSVQVNDQSSFRPDKAKFWISQIGVGVVDSLQGMNGQFLPNQPGQYQISYMVERSCMKDTLHQFLLVRSLPSFSLGNDTVVCGGSSVQIAANTPLATTWWNGATTNSMNISAPGAYWAEVSDGLCAARDTVSVDFKAIPNFAMEAQLTGCEGASLDIGPALPMAGSWQWSHGVSGAQAMVSQPGTYTLTRTLDGCSFDAQVQVAFLPNPIVQMPQAVWLCEQADLVLQADVKCDYLQWNTGETTSAIHVNAPGIYSVTAFAQGCVGTATTEVHLQQLPSLELPNDVTACEGEPVRLVPIYNEEASSFLWSDGQMEPTITVTEPGIYTLQAANTCGMAEASVTVAFSAKPTADLGSDRSLCQEKEVLLQAPVGDFTYHWSDGSDASQLRVHTPGTYSVSIENACGIAMDEVVVTGPENQVQVPNVFTPNADGINDLFLTGATGPNFGLSIMDRWGKNVFSTQNPLDGWDGRLNDGTPATEGTYYYTLHYRGCDGQPSDMAGPVTLMR